MLLFTICAKMLYRTYKGGIRLTTQQIRFFLEAAECLNFTEAAKRLFVAQSTLSKQIALLEDELGLKLFYRSNRTVGLTPAGSLFRGEMEKVEHRLTEAIDRARHVNRGLDGTLSVGILDIIDPSLFVSPLLKLFQERYPRVELSISLCGFSKLREGLEKGLLDVGFGKGFDLFSLPDLEGMEVYQNSPSILMPSRHPLALADRLEVPQLKDEQFVVLSQDECGASVYTLVDLCGKDGFYPKISRYVDSNADRVYAVSLGYGISIIDLEFPIPSWAGLVTVPLYSRANGVFQGIHVRMVWSCSGTNPSIRLLAALARQLIQNKEEARL